MFELKVSTEMTSSRRSNTTRASICQYRALCNPLCSNHILPGYGQGILPLKDASKFKKKTSSQSLIKHKLKNNAQINKLASEFDIINLIQLHQNRKFPQFLTYLGILTSQKLGDGRILPFNEIGDEISEPFVVSESRPNRFNISINWNLTSDSAFPPRQHFHFTLNLPLS